MQINKINHIDQNKYITGSKKKNYNNNTASFKGGVDSFCLGVADLIENGGLFVSFTLQDMLGTNLPRPIMGLMRNKKENEGKKNFKFAAKEMVREFTTGPSMFIIPGALLSIGKKAFGKATEIPMKLIKAFGQIHAANPLNAEGFALTKEEFFQSAYEQIIKNAKGETEISEKTTKTAKKFAKALYASLTDKKELKKTISELNNKFVNISKNHAQDAVHADFTTAIISNEAKASFKDTTKFLISYADDVVEKASKQSPDKIKGFVNKITNKKVIGRFAANAIMYGAVMLFLQYIPKLYNKAEGKDNAGLKGLMKEETLNDKSLDDIKPVNKSNPSFGSSAGVVNKLTGNGLIGKIAGGMEFQGCNVSFPLLLGIMGFGILFPRIRQAKDKYDREEILRRDVITCITMCFAEKAFRKGFSKNNEIKSGLVLANKAPGFKDQNILKRLFDYLRPIKGVQVLNTDQIYSKYSNIGAYKNGILGFCDFIDGQGGNLAKVFSIDDQAKEIVESLLNETNKTLNTSNNSTIKEVLKTAQQNKRKEIKNLVDRFKLREAPPKDTLTSKVINYIKNTLVKLNIIKQPNNVPKNMTNPWVTKARTLNARFTALSVLVIVPLFLGFFLPWLNEKSTKKRIKEEQAGQNSSNLNNYNLYDTSYLNKIQKSNNIFSDMQNFNK